MIEETGRVDMETYSRAQIRYTNLEKDNKLSSESFEQSKNDTLNLVTSKIEKFTKDDKNRQGLKCSFKGCYFTTSATLKKCKARKQIKQHEEKHKKEKAPINVETTNNDQVDEVARSKINVETAKYARSVTPEIGKYADKTSGIVTTAD